MDCDILRSSLVDLRDRIQSLLHDSTTDKASWILHVKGGSWTCSATFSDQHSSINLAYLSGTRTASGHSRVNQPNPPLNDQAAQHNALIATGERSEVSVEPDSPARTSRGEPEPQESVNDPDGPDVDGITASDGGQSRAEQSLIELTQGELSPSVLNDVQEDENSLSQTDANEEMVNMQTFCLSLARSIEAKLSKRRSPRWFKSLANLEKNRPHDWRSFFNFDPKQQRQAVDWLIHYDERKLLTLEARVFGRIRLVEIVEELRERYLPDLAPFDLRQGHESLKPLYPRLWSDYYQTDDRHRKSRRQKLYRQFKQGFVLRLGFDQEPGMCFSGLALINGQRYVLTMDRSIAEIDANNALVSRLCTTILQNRSSEV